MLLYDMLVDMVTIILSESTMLPKFGPIGEIELTPLTSGGREMGIHIDKINTEMN